MKKRIGTIVLLCGVVAAGFWLAGRQVAPSPESSARLAAVGALAPGRPTNRGGPSVELPPLTTAEFVEVEMSGVPTGADDANGLRERWLRGEVDLMENESILPAAEIAALQARSMNLRPSSGVQLATQAVGGIGPNAAAPAAPATGVNFQSIDYTQSGGFVPPDPELAAGPNHLIAVVNTSFAIYDKSGGQLRAPGAIGNFMRSNVNCTGVFDPNILYDESADRFIMGVDANGTHYCVAVTVTGDPLGTWRVYAFRTASGNDFFDYPHAGIGKDFLFMGANIFAGNSFKEGRLWAIDKGDMYAGRAADVATKALPTTEDTPQPLHLHGWNQGTWPTDSAHTFFTDTNYNGATYSVWRWTNPLGGTNPTKVGQVNLEQYTGVTAGFPVNAPQSGSNARIQANDWRPHDFEYRDGFAWSAQTIACNPGNGTVNCLRWAKINPATATVVDAGVYASNGEHRLFGNLAVNRCGDMAVGYTKTSGGMFPSVFVTGRLANDPARTLQAEAQVRAGAITYTAFDGSPHRWGDYTGMTIDPDGERFWYLGQFSKNTGTINGRWATNISAHTFAGCSGGGGGGEIPPMEISVKGSGTLGGVAFTSADIISRDAGGWSMRFDASDVGVTKNLTAFYRQDRPGALPIYYLVFAANQPISGLGTATAWDVIKFTPTQLGATTAGAFEWYFDGSDVGLTTSGEKIDALGMDGDGRLLISLAGSGAVPRAGGNLRVADEDIIAFSPTTTGQNTAGTWAAFFDGSAAVSGLAVEDINGFWDAPSSGDLYVTILGSFNVGGVKGGDNDIVKLTPGGGGAYTASMYWNGRAANLGITIDAVELTSR